MRRLALAAALLAAAPAAADDPVWSRYHHLIAGLGAAPLASGPHASVSWDWGLYPFDGAFSTGISLEVGMNLHGTRWYLAHGGVFVRLDLTYLLLTGLWSRRMPPERFPVRLQLGSRLGIDATWSFQPRDEVPSPPAYLLVRPVLHSFADLEVPLPGEPWGKYAVFVRATLDTPVNLSTVIRWGVVAGFTWGYGPQ